MDKLSAMIVEDDPKILAIVKKVVLQVAPGIKVTTVDNGLDAGLILNDTPPDILITDLMMPKMDGASLIEFVQDNACYQTIRAMVITGLSPTDDLVKRVNNSGFFKILYKPFSIPALKDSVLELVANATEEKQKGVVPIFDREAALRQPEVDEVALERSMTVAISALPNELYALEDGICADDLVRTEEVAHTIMGLTCGIGAAQVCSLASTAEEAARSGDLAQLGMIFPELKAACQRYATVVGGGA